MSLEDRFEETRRDQVAAIAAAFRVPVNLVDPSPRPILTTADLSRAIRREIIEPYYRRELDRKNRRSSE